LTEIISHTENPEKLVAMSACIINQGMTNEMAENLAQDELVLKKIIGIVLSDKRKRELEQVNFTIRINGISLAGLTHLVRHRIQSIMVPSFNEAGKSNNYIVPESIKANSELFDRYMAACLKSNEVFERIKHYGIVSNDLVYLFLSGNTLDVITTINARELFHFIQLRTCNRAQWEIREIAVDLLKKLRTVAPLLFDNAGPHCYMDGHCKEGKMSCGLSREIRAFFSAI
jgi:thymidylate synthase (FAD)